LGKATVRLSKSQIEEGIKLGIECYPEACHQAFAAIPAIVMLLARSVFSGVATDPVIVAFAVGLPYLTLLTMREERRARVQMPQFPPSPAPSVQRTLLSSTGRRLLPPSGIRQDEAAPAQAASELPEFLDLSPEEFALYFDAYEKRRPALSLA
jgi:hypothetical protein